MPNGLKDYPAPSSEIILYQTEDGRNRIEVRLENETVWLTQKMMAELFQKDVRTINEHILNIFSEKELQSESVIREYRITADDGKSYLTKHYNLDVIISVGYRVKSQRGTQFRIWATQRLREYNGCTRWTAGGRCRPWRIGSLIPWDEANPDDIPPRCLRRADDAVGLGTRDLPYGRKKGPLVGVRNHGSVKKHAIRVVARLFLQRECNEVPELALGERVLIWKESVIRSQANLGPSLHGLREKMRANFPCENGWHGLFKEQPEMCAVAGARAFECGWDT